MVSKTVLPMQIPLADRVEISFCCVYCRIKSYTVPKVVKLFRIVDQTHSGTRDASHSKAARYEARNKPSFRKNVPCTERCNMCSFRGGAASLPRKHGPLTVRWRAATLDRYERSSTLNSHGYRSDLHRLHRGIALFNVSAIPRSSVQTT